MRTTIMADEATLDRLRRLAKSREISLGDLVREALAEKLERDQPALSFLGAARRGSDAVPARRADEEGLYRADDPRGDGVA